MAEIKAAEKKGGRRSSIMAIAKRVRQFEQGWADRDAPIAGAKRQDYNSDEPSRTSSTPKTASASPDIYSLNPEPQDQDYAGGADIPDIPLRRNKRTIKSANLDSDTLSALEQILTVGTSQKPQQTGSLGNNPISSPYRMRTDNRYDDQSVDLDQDFKGEGRLLYPVSECSTEWESNSLPDVPEGEESPDPSLRGESAASANYTTKLPPRFEPPNPSDLSVELPTAPGNTSHFQPGLQPKLIVPSLTATETSRTDMSDQTEQAMTHALPALQSKGVDDLEDGLQPVDEETMEQGSFDLIVPSRLVGVYSLERRSELLFSTEHLRVIFADPIFLTRFTSFVAIYRPPSSIALLNYALDALKAIRAMDWMNAIISKSLRPEGRPQHSFFLGAVPELTANESLRRKAAAAMDALARDELPAYVTHVWTDTVEISMKRKITGSMPAHLRDMSEGLAEVFCLSDPSRPDNPIVFASEEFHRTTQYGPDYVLGRNCRFLQGPKTNPFAVQRIRDMLKQGKEHYETFLNYRRDGLPFMNLLMCTPLFDSKGQVRYHLGAQVDVSGLAKDCSGLESLRRLVDRDEEQNRTRNGYVNSMQRRDSGTDFDDIPGGSVKSSNANAPVGAVTAASSRAPLTSESPKDEFRLLAEAFNRDELETVRRFGGRMHRSQQEQVKHVESHASANWAKPRVVLNDSSPPASPPLSPHINPTQQQQLRVPSGGGDRDLTDANGNICLPARPRSPAFAASSPSQQSNNNTRGSNMMSMDTGSPPRAPAIFENYLVVRPYPSLRILFASRSMRVPGILQSHLMSRIGGSRRIHDELEQAFAMGQSVTAKVKWISGTGLRNANAAQQVAAHGQGKVNGNGVVPDWGSTSTVSTNNNNYNTNTNTGSPRPDTVGMDGRPRWIHCTPLASTTGAVGVWVVVIVDEESEATERAVRRRQDLSTAGVNDYSPAYNNGNSNNNSPRSPAPTNYAGGYHSNRQPPQQQQPRAAAWDEMSLTDFASMNRLPEDQDLRQHLREMYEETRRRERHNGGGGNDRDGGGRMRNSATGGTARPGSRAGTWESNTGGGGGGGAGGATARVLTESRRFDGSGRSSTPDSMSNDYGVRRM